MAALTVTTIVLFGFDLSQVGWAVIPVAWILVLNGWALALARDRPHPPLRAERRDPDLGPELRGHGPVRRVLPGRRRCRPGLRSIASVLPDDVGLLGAAATRSTVSPSLGRLRRRVRQTSLLLIVLSGLLATHLLKVFRRRGFVTRYS